MTLLTAENIFKTYQLEGRRIEILTDVNLAIASGEFLVIQGSSGSGKSTLLSVLSGLDYPDSGKVLLSNQDICSLSEDELAPLRNTSFGFVFQAFYLIPSLTVLENVMFPAELNKDKQAAQKAKKLLAALGMEKRLASYPSQLSGGEKQRAAICRALINDPEILFADEPTGNLDSKNGQTILNLMLDLRRQRGTTLIMVTHSASIAERADRVLLLKDGKIS